jgi:N-carbamoyl-L-amino-acid hydrolase
LETKYPAKGLFQSNDGDGKHFFAPSSIQESSDSHSVTSKGMAMTAPDSLRINGERLWARLQEMARIGGTSIGGCNRQALTDLDREGRDLFVRWAKEAGCTINIDQAGNIFARKEGSDPDAEPVMTGSHLDTQATGGKFDGVYGVLAGLEVVQTLHDARAETRRSIEVAVWTNEEGCRFAPAMLGSGVVAGVYDLDFAYSRRDKDGLSFGDELRRIGNLGELPAAPRDFAAVFEAHIEQGPILDHEGTTIGIVKGIQGAYWFDVTLTGASAHAGPTPMDMRRDPWRALIEIVQRTFELADSRAPWGRATFGDIKALPGARNTVPEKLILTVDIRHPDPDELEAMVLSLRQSIAESAAAHQIDAHVEQVWHMPPTAFDPFLVDQIAQSAALLGLPAREIISGAGHDSLHTAKFAPTAMIFVPCAEGVSHNELEAATPEDLTAGANVLLHAMLAIANDQKEAR